MTSQDQSPLPELPPIEDVLRLIRAPRQKPSEYEPQKAKKMCSEKREVIISMNQELTLEMERINPRLKPYQCIFLTDEQVETIARIESRYPNSRLNFFQFGYEKKYADLVYIESFEEALGSIMNKRLLLVNRPGYEPLSAYRSIILNGIGIGD